MNHEDTNHRPTRGDGWRAWGRWALGRNLCPHEWGGDYEFLASWKVVHGIGTSCVKDHVIQTMQWCSLCGASRRKPDSARWATESDLAQGIEAGTGETRQGLDAKHESAVGEADAPHD